MPHGVPPALQRRPHAAIEAKAVDRDGAAEREHTPQLHIGPLEAALLQHAARGRIDHAGAGAKLLAAEFLEGVVDHRARCFGRVTLAPERDAEPVADLWCGEGKIDADAA